MFIVDRTNFQKFITYPRSHLYISSKGHLGSTNKLKCLRYSIYNPILLLKVWDDFQLSFICPKLDAPALGVSAYLMKCFHGYCTKVNNKFTEIFEAIEIFLISTSSGFCLACVIRSLIAIRIVCITLRDKSCFSEFL